MKKMMIAVAAVMAMSGVAEANVYIPRFPMPRPVPQCPFRHGCVPPRVPLPVLQPLLMPFEVSAVPTAPATTEPFAPILEVTMAQSAPASTTQRVIEAVRRAVNPPRPRPQPVTNSVRG